MSSTSVTEFASRVLSLLIINAWCSSAPTFLTVYVSLLLLLELSIQIAKIWGCPEMMIKIWYLLKKGNHSLLPHSHGFVLFSLRCLTV